MKPLTAIKQITMGIGVVFLSCAILTLVVKVAITIVQSVWNLW